jgi:hypothetical protein
MNHFKNFPLRTKKFADYCLFQEILDLFHRKAHLTPAGLQEIINLRACLNKGLSLELKAAFSDTIPLTRPLVNDQEIKDPY